MVEENAIRAELSPWEQAMVAVKSARAEAHPGIDAAIEDALRQPLPPEARPPAHHRPPRRRPRRLPDRPETLSDRQLLRLAPLIPRGYGDLLRATLAETAADRPRRRMARPPPDPPRSRTPRAHRPRPRPPRPPPPRPRPPPPRPHHPPRADPARLGPALHRPQRHERHARLRLRRDRAPVQPARAAGAVEAPPSNSQKLAPTPTSLAPKALPHLGPL